MSVRVWLSCFLGFALVPAVPIAAGSTPCLSVPARRGHVPVRPQAHSSAERSVLDGLEFYQATRGVDFAGRFTLAQLSCGAGCIRLAAMDAFSGHVHWFGHTVTNWPSKILVPLFYRSDSRLLGVLGSLDEAGNAGWHWFAFDGAAFLPVAGPPAGCRPAALPRN